MSELLEKKEESSDKNLRLQCIDEDHKFILENLPPSAIITLTKEFITVVIMRTPYSRIQLRVIYNENYPFEAPILEITSQTLPIPLLRNKEKECTEKALERKGEAQFKIIYEQLYDFIHNNLFIPCWKEVKQVAALCKDKGKLAADETKGVFKMRLKCKNYTQAIDIQVPYMYPEEGIKIDFLSSNLPLDIQIMFKSQAEEIVRRCVAGFSPDEALKVSNPIDLPGSKTKSKDSKVKITSDSLKNIKHDVNVLKQMSDLRLATNSGGKKDQYFTQINAERREARKDLRRLAKAEMKADEEQLKAMLAEEEEEMKQLMNAKISDVAQPSLLATCKFLINDYIARIPNELCQKCQKPVLPEDPESSAVKNPKSNKRPMRTFCGHWLHYCCLDEWLTTPPFIRQCPVCDRRIWHPDWPEDIKQLEKAWQSKEARKREVSDVSDFMGMGGDFCA